tara:strand:- start:205 stop:987 length:783 start_codon:yes stop_codon:yes gene_type:complete
MKYTVCTTFNANGHEKYGRRMIETFLQSWPQDVVLKVYAEGCAVDQTAPNLEVLDLESVSTELVAFKNTWRDVPKANGNIGVKGQGKEFKYQAVRFAHKVYAIFHAARHATTDWLIWMDADMVCHSPMTAKKLNEFFPDSSDLCFAGRSRKFTECGLYGMHVTEPAVQAWLADFQHMYDDAESGIFTLAEWHDSYVFDAVRQRHALRELDWTGHLNMGEGHPLINCEWGAYIDHLKGERKSLGRSRSSDLRVSRSESYWR